jgi:phage shock protein PspC (stress-responsive transcriptional regulator)
LLLLLLLLLLLYSETFWQSDRNGWMAGGVVSLSRRVDIQFEILRVVTIRILVMPLLLLLVRLTTYYYKEAYANSYWNSCAFCVVCRVDSPENKRGADGEVTRVTIANERETKRKKIKCHYYSTMANKWGNRIWKFQRIRHETSQKTRKWFSFSFFQLVIGRGLSRREMFAEFPSISIFFDDGRFPLYSVYFSV